MTVNDRRLDELAPVENGRINGNHRRIDHGAVERAAADLLRALGADVNAEALGASPSASSTGPTLHQGPAAALNLLGQTSPYDRLPYFFSDQYEVGMEYSGFARDWDRVVLRGDPAIREFIAFWISDERVVAGMNVNVWDVQRGGVA